MNTISELYNKKINWHRGWCIQCRESVLLDWL